MSEHDRNLIRKAEKMNHIYWSKVDGLIEQAESEEAKQELHHIQQRMYHREEAAAGCL